MRFLLLIAFLIFSSSEDPKASWQVLSPKKAKENDTVQLAFKAKVEKNWYIYGTQIEADGPLATEISWEKSSGAEIIGKIDAVNPTSKFDELWGGNVTYFKNKAEFVQKIKVKEKGSTLSGKIRYQVCYDDPLEGVCINEEFPFTVQL